MKKVLSKKSGFVVVFLFLSAVLCFGEVFTLKSPDGQFLLEIDSQGATFSLKDGESLLIGESQFGLATFWAKFPRDAVFLGADLSGISDDYSLLHGKVSSASYRANELRLNYEKLSSKGALSFTSVFQLSDKGLALRYEIGSNSLIKVRKELTEFNLPTVTTCWAQKMSFFPSYERIYEQFCFDELKPASNGYAVPLLAKADDNYLLLTESGKNRSYAVMRLQKERGKPVFTFDFPKSAESAFSGSRFPQAVGKILTTWKVILIGSLDEVVESTLVTDLADPQDEIFEVVGTDWIRSGISAWDWLNDSHTGDPEIQRVYIEKAAEYGWPYVLIDANWSFWNDGDYEPVLKELVAYADSLGVGLMIWYNSGGPHNPISEAPRDRMLDPEIRRNEMAWLAEMGFKGIKVDFFRGDKQQRMVQYFDILEDAAREGLMVNFHGCTAPRGLHRTWPNLVSMEAVRGGEYYRGGESDVTAMPCMLYCFTRNVVGAIDYTPFFIDPRFVENGMDYAVALAQIVLYESASTNFAGSVEFEDEGYPALFRESPEIMELLRDIPTAWDETRLLEGDPESHVVIGRRNGDRFYIAGMNAGDSFGYNLAEKVSSWIEKLTGKGVADLGDIEIFYSGDDPYRIEYAASLDELGSDVFIGKGEGFLIAF